VVAVTQRFTTALERMVRKAPEQYFWLHRRWKHQPVGRRRRVA
jgi:KDO2-lipid IV(A) lauroyltransferase